MGKKKDNSRNLFRDSIDPRFSGIFKSSTVGNASENSSSAMQPPTNIEVSAAYPEVNENAGFQNFLSMKLTEFLDSHIKEVDRPVSEPEFFSNKLESIQLFSDSDAITKEETVESIKIKSGRKKRKKERSDKELLKEVAVSYDWLQRQSQILNS